MALHPMYRAVDRGDVEEVLRLIHQDPQLVNTMDEDGCTPLLHASEEGHVSVVGALVDHGANIDHQGHDGSTALNGACLRGHIAVVELLLEKGANPTLPDQDDVTPLMMASFRGHVTIVTRLLRHSSVLSTINHCDHDNGCSALSAACLEGHSDIVKMLLEAGADPTIRHNNGQIAMDIATGECVDLLEEWDRSYTITKARLLYDAFCCYQYHYHQQQQQQDDDYGASAASSSSSGGQVSSCSNQQPRMEAVTPTYLKGRVEGEQPLPKVEMVDGYEEGSLVESVLEYVICGGLKGDLFVELMEMMGKVGVREEDEDEEEGTPGNDDDSVEEEGYDDDESHDGGDEEEDENDEEGAVVLQYLIGVALLVNT